MERGGLSEIQLAKSKIRGSLGCHLGHFHLQLKIFEQYVEQALKGIPQNFRDMMENITIEVEPEQIVFDKDRQLILGLYTGAPLPQRGPAYQNVLPDKIVIYQRAFLSFPNEKLPSLIANVLQHEIGHYFGMSEEELWKYKKV
jgi:predicted Zn-dependent protease with MMP-like domain